MEVSLSCTDLPSLVNGDIDNQDWFVAYTQPQREQLARINLELQGFEAYLCEIKIFRNSPNGLLESWEPMFPRYIFFRPGHAGQSFSAACSTRGISHVLRFGINPAILKAEEFRAIKALESSQNQVDIKQASAFQAGAKVRLQNCGLNGLEALVYSVSKKRITLLIELLGSQKKLELKHHQLKMLAH